MYTAINSGVIADAASIEESRQGTGNRKKAVERKADEQMLAFGLQHTHYSCEVSLSSKTKTTIISNISKTADN